MKTDATI